MRLLYLHRLKHHLLTTFLGDFNYSNTLNFDFRHFEYLFYNLTVSVSCGNMPAEILEIDHANTRWKEDSARH